jgi:hypothetical protein
MNPKLFDVSVFLDKKVRKPKIIFFGTAFIVSVNSQKKSKFLQFDMVNNGNTFST